MVLAGTPFREAYKQVGMAVQRGEYHPTREVHHTHEGSIGNLCTAQIRRKMERVMQEFSRRGAGGQQARRRKAGADRQQTRRRDAGAVRATGADVWPFGIID